LVAIVTVSFIILHVHIVLDLSYILPCFLIWTFVFWLNGVWQLYKSAIDGVVSFSRFNIFNVYTMTYDVLNMIYAVVGS